MCDGDLVRLHIIICNKTKPRKCVPYDVKNHIRMCIWRWWTHKRKMYFERKSPGNDRNFRSGGYVYLAITRNCKEIWLSGHHFFILTWLRPFLQDFIIVRISLYQNNALNYRYYKIFIYKASLHFFNVPLFIKE